MIDIVFLLVEISGKQLSSSACITLKKQLITSLCWGKSAACVTDDERFCNGNFRAEGRYSAIVSGGFDFNS